MKHKKLKHNRHFKHWIKDGFLKFTEDTESTERLLTFAAISGIGAVLERRVILEGRKKRTPATYIWIVGPAGMAKKTTTCDYMMELIYELDGINVCPGQITPAAFIQLLGKESSRKDVIYNNKSVVTTPMLIYAPELTDFMTDLAINTGMNDLLNNLFDEKKDYLKRTKFSSNDDVFYPTVSMLGCTTPESVIKVIPVDKARAGLGTRIIFVPEFRPLPEEKFNSYPEMRPEHYKLKGMLMQDLERIYKLTGTMKMTTEAKIFYDKWYKPFRRRGQSGDPRLVGFTQRMDVHVLKLAMIDSVCRSDSLIIETENIQQAIDWLSPLEPELHKIYKSGRNDLYPIAEEVLTYIKAHGKASVGMMLRNFNIHISNKELSLILKDLEMRGDIRTDDYRNFYPNLVKSSSHKPKRVGQAVSGNGRGLPEMNGE